MSNFLEKKIVIYPHLPYSPSDGGINVQYYLASLLKSHNIDIKMFNNCDSYNQIFSDFTNNIDIENTIVIYCEGIVGNPLNAKYVVRWMLSELGKNVPSDRLFTWGKNELVYYYLSEKKIKDSPEKIDSIYKFLTTIYLKPNTFINYNRQRNGYCHIFKKSHYHKNGIQQFHPPDSIELRHFNNYEELVNFFNRFEYFVCYDPCSFLVFLAGLCGCIPILHKVDGISKEQWFTGKGDINSAHYEYYLNHPYTNYPGIAYGIEDLEYARSTIHLLPDFFNNIIEYVNKQSLEKFIIDMQNFGRNINTVENNYY
jgi:hypothetical protein